MDSAGNISRRTNEAPEVLPGDRSGRSSAGTARRCRRHLHHSEAFKRTPCAADLQPAGRHIAKHMVEGAGVPLLLRTLLDHGHLPGERVTDTGRAVVASLRSARRSRDQTVVHPGDRPLSASGGVVGPRGNLVPAGAIVKVVGTADLQSIAAARCFDGEDARRKAVKKKHYREGDVLVIRYAEARPRPGMRGKRAIIAALREGRNGSVALLDLRQFSSAIPHCLFGHDGRPAAPDGAVGRVPENALGAEQHCPAVAAERACHARV